MKRKINLFTSFYPETNPDRLQELTQCLLKNSCDANIDRIILLNNPRPTYKDFFLHTQNFPNDINIIANTDIFFDGSITALHNKEYNSDMCFVLTRWDVSPTHSIHRFVDRGSQDAWIFFGAVKNIDKMDCDFSLGIPGCDNRIAWELKKAEYKVYNPSEDIRILHLHNSGIRNYHESQKLYGNHLLLDATSLNNLKDTIYYDKILTPERVNPKIQENSPEGITAKVRDPLIPPASVLRTVRDRNLRILHVAMCAGHNGLTKAFRAFGAYDEIDWGKILREKGKEELNKEIIRKFDEFKPNLVFMQIQTDDLINPQTCKYISEKAFIMNWGGDKREGLSRYYTELAPFVSVTCCTCEDDVEEMRRKGWKAEFVQIGFDPEIYHPGIQVITEYPAIVFTGNNYENLFPLSGERKRMVEFLRTELGEKFRVIGNGWAYPNSGWVDQKMEARVFNSVKIAINLNHFNSLRYTSDRIFRIMGSGAFCLSQAYNGIEKDFAIGKDLDVFRNNHELFERIQYYLSNDALRNQIASSGRMLVHSKFTFDHMVENIYNVYNKYKKVLEIAQ